MRVPARFWWDHRWARTRLSAYLDAELSQHARTRIEHHLGDCPECRRLLAGLRATLELLGRLGSPRRSAVAPAIAASVRERLDSLD